MEFQTRIEMNLISQQKSQDLTILYDYYDKKAEILTRAQNKTVRTIYYFDKNEQLTIQGLFLDLKFNLIYSIKHE